jgi:hypothetical protein
MRSRWALIGLMAVVFWGGLATVVLFGHQSPDPGLKATLLRVAPSDDAPRVRPVPRPRLDGYWMPLGPSWAPHGRPRVLGLATGTYPTIVR